MRSLHVHPPAPALRDVAPVVRALAILLVLSGRPGTAGLAAQAPPAGLWQGRSYAERVSDLRWVTLTIRYESDFWFALDARGGIDGYAVARYTMSLDDGRLRDVIAGLTAAANGTVGAVAPAGLAAVLGLTEGLDAIRSIVGMDAGYDDGTAVRAGRIRGRLDGDRMSIDWSAPPDAIPYRTERLYPTRREVVSATTGPAYSPWNAAARVSNGPGGWWALVPEGDRRSSQGQATRVSYWFVRHQGLCPPP